MGKTRIKRRPDQIRGETGSKPSPRHRPPAKSKASRSSPRSRNPEVLLISAVINTGDTLSAVDAGITTDWFEHDDGGPYQRHWAWLEDYQQHHHRAPSEAAFLTQFPQFPLVETDEVDHAIDAMRQAYSKRQMAGMIKRSAQLLKGGEVDDAVDLVRGHMLQIDAKIAPANPLVSSLHDTSDTVEHIERMMQRKAIYGQPGLPTGFHNLDKRTGGLQEGQLWLWAARLSNGKTWSLINIAAHAAMQGARVHFWSLEQTKHQIDVRLHVFLAHLLDGNSGNLSVDALTTGEGLDMSVYRDYLGKIRRDVPGEVLCHQPGRGGVSPRTISAAVERERPDLVLVDYISLLTSEGPETEWRASAKLSKGLKEIAIANGIPVAAAAQINREGDKGTKVPRTGNLADSDNYGRDADLVITMAKQSPSVSKMMVDKTRSGASGYAWWVHFGVDTGVLRACTGDQAHDLMNDDEDRLAEAEEEAL